MCSVRWESEEPTGKCYFGQPRRAFHRTKLVHKIASSTNRSNETSRMPAIPSTGENCNNKKGKRKKNSPNASSPCTRWVEVPTCTASPADRAGDSRPGQAHPIFRFHLLPPLIITLSSGDSPKGGRRLPLPPSPPLLWNEKKIKAKN